MTLLLYTARTTFALGTRPAGTIIGSPRTGVVRMCPMGSSTTNGVGDPLFRAYRTTVGQKILDSIARREFDSGLDVQMVGPLQSGIAPWDHHYGVDGATCATLISGAPSHFAPGEAFDDVDIFLSHVGVNNCASDAELTAAMSEDVSTSYRGLYRLLYSYLPDAVYIVGTVPRAGDSARLARIATFNAALPAYWTQLAGEGLTIATYDSDVVINGVHFAGNPDVHPNPDGYGLIGAAMWPAVCNSLGYDAQW